MLFLLLLPLSSCCPLCSHSCELCVFLFSSWLFLHSSGTLANPVSSSSTSSSCCPLASLAQFVSSSCPPSALWRCLPTLCPSSSCCPSNFRKKWLAMIAVAAPWAFFSALSGACPCLVLLWALRCPCRGFVQVCLAAAHVLSGSVCLASPRCRLSGLFSCGCEYATVLQVALGYSHARVTTCGLGTGNSCFQTLPFPNSWKLYRNMMTDVAPLEFKELTQKSMPEIGIFNCNTCQLPGNRYQPVQMYSLLTEVHCPGDAINSRGSFLCFHHTVVSANLSYVFT